MKQCILFILLVLAVHANTFFYNRNFAIRQLSESELREIADTGSMKPAMDEHCLVLVQYRPWHSLKVGDVIIYRSRDPDSDYEFIIHRIIRISSGGSVVVCKGDANPSEDRQLIFESDYVGRAVGQIALD